jgi:hypothetical protein
MAKEKRLVFLYNLEDFTFFNIEDNKVNENPPIKILKVEKKLVTTTWPTRIILKILGL